ncbi:MAG TPA: hypothetical protein PLX41_05420 [Bacteroidales bacterium]|nr:hypothetical protein [Bacteroidales bacterium]
MNINKLFFKRLSVLLLLFLILFVFIIIFHRTSSFGKREVLFAVDPVTEITKIELREGERELVLAKDNEGWKVNSTIEARKNAVLFFLEILTGMQIKSPVSADLFDKEIKTNNSKPVRVKIVSGRKTVRSYLVYRTKSNRYGNIMKMRERAKPFIVSLPGNEVDIGSFFTADELFWSPFIIFNSHPEELNSVSLENNADTAASFKITVSSEGEYILSDTKNELKGWDTSRVQRYLSYFIHVPFESPVTDITASEKENIVSHDPVCIISVEKDDGDKKTLILWERTKEGQKDNDRLWARIEGKDELLIVKYFDIDPLLKKRSYFFTGQPGDE